MRSLKKFHWAVSKIMYTIGALQDNPTAIAELGTAEHSPAAQKTARLLEHPGLGPTHRL
jgi:hypothetical protein